MVGPKMPCAQTLPCCLELLEVSGWMSTTLCWMQYGAAGWDCQEDQLLRCSALLQKVPWSDGGPLWWVLLLSRRLVRSRLHGRWHSSPGAGGGGLLGAGIRLR
jgi:hypothetical protein